jgi:DNA mismatch repair ATPase MutS
MLPIGIVGTAACAFYCLFVKPVRDTGNFIEPLRVKCIGDPAFSRAIDAVGMIDELLSSHDFAGELPHATVLPEVGDDDHHFFEATGLKNPVLAKSKADFVPNDVRMNGSRLTFISGPNSGGKTTICKSIVHNQLLAQAGAYVLAEKAAINIADMISYQAPKFDGLQDDEGRFGTELGRTRDIFYATSPKSLVILDELAEGTTYEERQQESFGILSDFHTIGNNTVLVTHNHSLVDKFMDAQKGQCFMVEFNGDEPTYRIIPGISRVSHADRVAKKINFSKADRQRYMQEKGYV